MVLPIVAILLLTFVMTLIIFPQFAEFCKFPAILQNFMRTKVSAWKPDPGILNCRVKISKQKEKNSPTDFFNVELYGTIPVQQEKIYAILQITISDITHRFRKPEPVHSTIKQYQQKNSLIFCYRADLGWISKAESTLFDWTPIAQLSRNHLTFPYTGDRLLQLKTSILSRDNNRKVASAVWSFDYENTSFGYVNLEQNIKNTKTLAVALAFAASSADGEICDCELEIIKDWAKRNIEITEIPEKASLELNKALQKTIRFFQKGNKVDAYKICEQIVKTVPAAERYVILELCLNVAKATGAISSEEMDFLKKLACWLQVDMERFRSMAEKIIPASMHQTQDNEVVLGITEEMTKEQARQHLNKEYRKWNARVTNTDPEIQHQADHMLELIAQARSQYT